MCKRTCSTIASFFCFLNVTRCLPGQYSMPHFFQILLKRFAIRPSNSMAIYSHGPPYRFLSFQGSNWWWINQKLNSWLHHIVNWCLILILVWGFPFVFVVSWPSVSKDKGTEVMTEILAWHVDMTETVLRKRLQWIRSSSFQNIGNI